MERNNQGCGHCPGGSCLKYPLFDDGHFWIVCDAHPLREGHILIVPKEHMPCMAALDEKAFARFKVLYNRVLSFLNKAYGRVAVFEHGIAGQTVPHAHVHFLPFGKTPGGDSPGRGAPGDSGAGRHEGRVQQEGKIPLSGNRQPEMAG